MLGIGRSGNPSQVYEVQARDEGSHLFQARNTEPRGQCLAVSVLRPQAYWQAY